MKINDYPKEIERATLDLAATCEEIAEVRNCIKEAEIETLASVIAAKGENNKPLHSNDKARDIAVFLHSELILPTIRTGPPGESWSARKRPLF